MIETEEAEKSRVWSFKASGRWCEFRIGCRVIWTAKGDVKCVDEGLA